MCIRDRKDNNRIYERFRGACDRFFEAKRAYYAGLKSEMEHNLALKNEICLAAEALARSEEWKKTTDELIALQARWKEVGPVPRRHSDQIWKRFRAACDSFFERKNKHFSAVDGQYEENLRLKEALLEEMEAADAASAGFEAIRDFQRRWTEIGFVPIKRKEAMQKRYKAAAVSYTHLDVYKRQTAGRPRSRRPVVRGRPSWRAMPPRWRRSRWEAPVPKGRCRRSSAS